MLIDRFLPHPEVSSRHEVEVDATAERAWTAARSLEPGRSRLVRGLMALRSLPGRFARRGAGAGLDGLRRTGFVVLAEHPGEEIVLGLVGRFWTPTAGIIPVAPGDFAAFDRPGYAVAVCNLTLRGPTEGPVRLATETRVRCTDAASRRRFRAYWTLVGPFSGLIRRELLRTLRDAAR